MKTIRALALTAGVAAAVALCYAPAGADTPAPIAYISPTFHQATCTSPASIDIPTSPHVVYSLDWIPGPAGNYNVGTPGLHEVFAVPDDANEPGYADWQYTTVVPSAAQCAAAQSHPSLHPSVWRGPLPWHTVALHHPTHHRR